MQSIRTDVVYCPHLRASRVEAQAHVLIFKSISRLVFSMTLRSIQYGVDLPDTHPRGFIAAVGVTCDQIQGAGLDYEKPEVEFRTGTRRRRRNWRRSSHQQPVRVLRNGAEEWT